MGWAQHHIAALQAGQTVRFRPRGNSMTPRIKSGELCIVEPMVGQDIEVGDVVLCKVRSAEYLHIVKAINFEDGQYLIGNNRGRINGWISKEAIYGRLIAIEP